MDALVGQLVKEIKETIPKWNTVYLVIDYAYPGFIRVFDNKAAANSYFNELNQYSGKALLVERQIETECEYYSL